MPPLGAEGALRDCLAPSNCECFYRENVVGVRLRTPFRDDNKSLLRTPEGAISPEKFLRKGPPMTTVRRPPWVKRRPPSPCPPPSRFSKYAAERIVQVGMLLNGNYPKYWTSVGLDPGVRSERTISENDSPPICFLLSQDCPVWSALCPAL